MIKKDPNGGLTSAGREFYKRTEGANLKPGVRNYDAAQSEDKKRWVRWALRFSKTPRPLTEPSGKPTRYALMFQAWGKPIPKNSSDVAAVHREALKRRAELGMGKDSAK
jgi:hypothetical protein